MVDSLIAVKKVNSFYMTKGRTDARNCGELGTGSWIKVNCGFYF